MTDHHLLVHDGTFARVTDSGDMTGARGTAPDGLFSRDARHLSRWELSVDGSPLQVLAPASRTGPCRPLTAVLTPPGSRDHPPACTVFREQVLADGALTERIRLTNNRPVPVTAHLRLTADADFADQYELRGDDRTYAKPGAVHHVEVTADGLAFRYERPAPQGVPAWLARTVVTAAPAPHTAEPTGERTAHSLRWTVQLPAHGSSDILLQVCALPSGADVGPPPLRSPGDVADRLAADRAAFTDRAPRPHDLTGWSELARACEQGLADLADLRLTVDGADGARVRVPAAGIPWFFALYGRDCLLTSFFALPYRPELAAASLTALAAVQGAEYRTERQEEPGRILHEMRHGELAHFGDVPYGRYYGAVDSTPLFLSLLHAYTQQVTDDALARRLEPVARAAVEWMFRDGGLGDRGWLVYSSDAEAGGLANLNWKDSVGAICFRDGTPAEGLVAVAEAQGYAYDALVRTAELARVSWGDAPYADRLAAAADDLRRRFHRDFWMADDHFPALALDGAGRRIDALASDAGHLLWSGILDAGHAAAVGRRLMEPDFFSGWGIRTLAAQQSPYHPLSYHRGSIWPHDNAVIALGLARYGLAEETRAVAGGLVEAAALHGWRLPEVLAGYDRGDHPSPVPYPHSCSPQAWAAATPLALLTALASLPGGAGSPARADSSLPDAGHERSRLAPDSRTPRPVPSRG
ncbi:glycogen debranching N-terminal domain-containing protein [Streptomyces sp. NPDC006283]|uniref:amylo-alpha-1,6-glucosidase n=1 Tax=Streptomyces sp. NPDC006283 TaxID=3156741 RepID=UPI0033B17AEB